MRINIKKYFSHVHKEKVAKVSRFGLDYHIS